MAKRRRKTVRKKKQTVMWKQGYRAKVEADDAFEQIEVVRATNDGDVTAEAVVDHARPHDNPIHPAFEWDDFLAAEKFRQAEARKMLRSLVVVVEADRKRRPTRKYEVATKPAPEESAETKPQRVYRSVEDVMADPEARAELLARALRELVAFRHRYHLLQELAIVFREMDKLLESLEV